MAVQPNLIGSTSNSSSGGFSLTVPSGAISGDLLILVIGSVNQTISTPSGFTLIGTDGTGSAGVDGAAKVSVFYKVHNGTDTTVTISDSGTWNSAILAAYTSVDSSDPIGTSATVNGTADPAVPPSITTTINKELVFAAVCTGQSSNLSGSGFMNTWTNSDLTEVSEVVESGTATGNINVGLGSGRKDTAGVVSAWSVDLDSSVNYAAVTFSINPDPTPTFVVDTGVFSIEGYSKLLGPSDSEDTPYDIFDIGTGIESIDISSSIPTGMAYKSDGSRVYIVNADYTISEYSLSDWAIATASFVQNITIPSVGYQPHAIKFNDDGTLCFIGTTVYIRKYTLSTAWDITTLSLDSSLYVGWVTGLEFDATGNTLFYTRYISSTNNKIHELDLPTAYSFSGATETTNVDLSSYTSSSISGLCFNDDGTRVYFCNSSAEKVYQVQLGAAYDLTSSFTVEYLEYLTELNNLYDIKFSTDGEKLYALSASTDRIYQYNLVQTYVTGDYGSFTLSGQSSVLRQGRVLTAANGSFTLSGQAAGFDLTYILNGIYGSYSLSGQDVQLRKSNTVMTADVGLFTASGLLADLRLGVNLTSSVGTFTLTGQAAELDRNVPITASYGAYTVSGQVAVFGREYILTADHGSWSLTADVSLSYGTFLASDYGSFSLTGQDITLVEGVAINAESGTFTLTGQDAGSLRTYDWDVSYGAFILTGFSFSGSPEVVTVTGQTAGITVAKNPKISRESQKFSLDNVVELFELDLTDLNGPVLRFTSTAWSDEAIQFGGLTYPPVPIEASGFETSARGTLPSPTIRVLNTSVLQGYINTLDDLQGATVRRIKTFKTFLDQGDTPDPNAHFPIDVYKVDRKVVSNKLYVEWELAASIDQEGRMIPSRQVLRNYCTKIYRRYDSDTGEFVYTEATCPYTSSNYFDNSDVSTTSASADRCGKRLSSCKKRFGDNAELPFSGFPGVSRIR